MLPPTTRFLLVCLFAVCLSCGTAPEDSTTMQPDLSQRLAKYTTFRLETDMSVLSEKERKMLPLLIDAAHVMDGLFWRQAYGDAAPLLQGASSSDERRFIEINYGPWDRLAGNEPFLKGVGPKPPGANFYPADMIKEEFEAAAGESPERAEALKSLYTLVRRDPSGILTAVPYHEAFATELETAAAKLREAAQLADDPGLKHYLELRAEALVTDNYQPSDIAWLDMKNNTVDIVIGPIETYEDQLFGYKAAYEAYVLVKDKEWSQRLAKYTTMLGELQENLPVDEKYKQETPGTESDLNAYDAIYYAGDCNSGSKTIAINLPNDEQVQLEKGTRRLQLKNSMRAKFDKILVPIAGVLIAKDQRPHVAFDAFFANTMFHEVAHGLGIKNTLNGKGTVREALRDKASALEEGKADILGLYMVTWLKDHGELGDADLMDDYVTFLAGIFRSIRFGTSSAHGNANLLRFNFFEEAGAFSRDPQTGLYRVEFDKMQQAVNSLSENILRLQGDGDYEAVVGFVDKYGSLGETLQQDLDRVGQAGIPVDVVFEQGL
jgi:Peptidase family M49